MLARGRLKLAEENRRPGRSLRAGLWRLADPKISLASMASMLLGSLAAAADGPLAPLWLLLTVAGIFAIEVAKNASGEIFDFDSGVDLAVAAEDRSPFSGGKRVLVDGLLTRRQTAVIAAVFYGVGALIGLVIVFGRDRRVLYLGIVGVVCAFCYQAPPLKLSYRGLGELAVAFCYGPLVACGTYLVQRGTVSPGLLLASVPLGLLIAAFLWINEFPDFRADASSGKRTLVVRLGRRRAAKAFTMIVSLALGLQAALPWLVPLVQRVLRTPPEAAGFRWPFWLGLAALPPAISAARRLRSAPESTGFIIPAQKSTLVAFLLLAVGSGCGFLVR